MQTYIFILYSYGGVLCTRSILVLLAHLPLYFLLQEGVIDLPSHFPIPGSPLPISPLFLFLSSLPCNKAHFLCMYISLSLYLSISPCLYLYLYIWLAKLPYHHWLFFRVFPHPPVFSHSMPTLPTSWFLSLIPDHSFLHTEAWRQLNFSMMSHELL